MKQVSITAEIYFNNLTRICDVKGSGNIVSTMWKLDFEAINLLGGKYIVTVSTYGLPTDLISRQITARKWDLFTTLKDALTEYIEI